MKSVRSLFSKFKTEKIHTTPGCIKPKRYKTHTLRSRIMPMPLPQELWLSLKQKDGYSLNPVVSIGDKVLKYQTVAEPTSPYGVSLHAPTSGLVTQLEPKLVAGAFKEVFDHLVLIPDHEDSSIAPDPTVDFNSISSAEIIKKLQNSGVSGLGGADFPTTVKLNTARSSVTELLIINAVECEPFISADEALVRERSDEIIRGIRILLKASGATSCVIAIEDHKTDSIESLIAALNTNNHPDIRLAIVDTKYPAGSEKQIIKAVTGKEVPANGFPADIGILVQNVGTAHAAYNAIVCGKPCISRVTTLAGSPLKTPKNFDVLLGTPIPFLLELCGIDHLEHSSTIIGGSLMGVTLFSEDAPVTRATNCVIATSRDWFPDIPEEQACIRCGFCAEACPVSLLPQQLYSYSRTIDLLNLDDQHLNDCIECGACSYVCPSNIPLVQYFRASKSTLQQHHNQSRTSAAWQERYQYHQYRIKKDKEEARNRKANVSKRKASEKASSAFSRSKAKAEIAAAVDRVRNRKSQSARQNIPGSNDGDGS